MVYSAIFFQVFNFFLFELFFPLYVTYEYVAVVSDYVVLMQTNWMQKLHMFRCKKNTYFWQGNITDCYRVWVSVCAELKSSYWQKSKLFFLLSFAVNSLHWLSLCKSFISLFCWCGKCFLMYLHGLYVFSFADFHEAIRGLWAELKPEWMNGACSF